MSSKYEPVVYDARTLIAEVHAKLIPYESDLSGLKLCVYMSRLHTKVNSLEYGAMGRDKSFFKKIKNILRPSNDGSNPIYDKIAAEVIKLSRRVRGCLKCITKDVKSGRKCTGCRLAATGGST
jgi:hypothetical protein